MDLEKAEEAEIKAREFQKNNFASVTTLKSNRDNIEAKIYVQRMAETYPRTHGKGLKMNTTLGN